MTHHARDLTADLELNADDADGVRGGSTMSQKKDGETFPTGTVPRPSGKGEEAPARPQAKEAAGVRSPTAPAAPLPKAGSGP